MRLGLALGNIGLGLRGADGGPVAPGDHAARCIELAELAEERGLDSVWVGDHLAIPVDPSGSYPYASGGAMPADTPVLDPIPVLSAVAARTEAVRLGFGVLVLPLRHPLVVAKSVATLDALSGGRVILGVGSGWLVEELEAVGVDPATRGEVTDRALAELREMFSTGATGSGDPPGHGASSVLPRPLQDPLPILIGGASAPAMRRVVRFGDGWDCPWHRPEQVADGLARLAESCEAAGRDPAELTVTVRGIRADRLDADLVDALAGCRTGALAVRELGVFLPPGLGADPQGSALVRAARDATSTGS